MTLKVQKTQFLTYIGAELQELTASYLKLVMYISTKRWSMPIIGT